MPDEAGFNRRKLLRIELRDHPDPDQGERCPGYVIVRRESHILGQTIEAVAPCSQYHAHQERLQVKHFDDGRRETEAVRAYGPNLQRSPDSTEQDGLDAWVDAVGLEERPAETIQQHAARCLAYMASRAKQKATQQAVLRLARAAGVDTPTMQAALDERAMTDQQFNQRMDELRKQRDEIETPSENTPAAD